MKANLDDITKVVTDKYPPLRASETRPSTAGRPSIDALGDGQRGLEGRTGQKVTSNVRRLAGTRCSPTKKY